MATPVLRLFDERLTKGEIEPDPAQREVAIALDALAEALRPWRPSRARVLSLFTRPQTAAPRGLYIHGGVGRGKTMLMDLFYEAVEFTPKNRCHFCEFMAGVHDKIARARHAVDGDPIPYVAAAIAADAGLLCFDEFQVTDIADAMILGRLFKVLFERGVVVVATSNAEPADLYKNGLNRQLFLPFIAELERRLECRELRAAKDFRLDKLSGRPLYFCPANAAARAALDTHWERLTGHHSPASAMLEVKGRKVIVPLASMGVARFRFSDLCEVPLGAIDYLSIAHAFHTLLIEDIPRLTADRRNEARRFINLIDTLYDNRICLIATAAAEPHALYPSGDGADHFERTASRLMEMRSEAYLGRAPKLGQGRPSLGLDPTAYGWR